MTWHPPESKDAGMGAETEKPALGEACNGCRPRRLMTGGRVERHKDAWASACVRDTGEVKARRFVHGHIEDQLGMARGMAGDGAGWRAP